MLFLEKSQPVRLLDIFVFGPFMIWYALNYTYHKKQKEYIQSRLTKTFLLLIGFYTIIYNAYNFVGHYIDLYPLM